jgi:subtilase family serine protease
MGFSKISSHSLIMTTLLVLGGCDLSTKNNLIDNRDTSIAASDTKQTSSLQHDFKNAADEYQVPVELLQVLAYYATNWEAPLDHDEEPGESEHHIGLHGIMGLSSETLLQASEQLGLSIEEIENSPKHSIRAVAALLHQKSRLAFEDDYINKTSIGDFFELVGQLGGSEDLVLEQYMSEEIYDILHQGYTVQLSNGESLTVPPLQSSAFNRSYLSTPIPSAYLKKNTKKLGQGVADSFISAHSANYTSTGGRNIKRIVIHAIEGSSGSAINWFRNKSARVSAHYIISKSGRITQMVREKDKAYHAKYHNSDTIGLEHGGHASRGDFTTAEYDASFKLICDIAKRHNIPVDRSHIVGHGELTHNANRYDPGKHWDWEGLIARVDACVNGTTGEPDVLIDKVWWTPENPTIGDEVTFHSRVKNAGLGSTSKNVGVRYSIDSEYIGWGAQGALSAKESSENFDLRDKTWTVPSYGVFTLSTEVDDTNIISESNEDNNRLSTKIVVNDPSKKADLVIKKLWYSPTDAEVGDTISLHATVSNEGDVATKSNVGIAYTIDGENIGWDATTVIEVGRSIDLNLREGEWKLPSQSTFNLSAFVDDGNIVDESNEENNKLSTTIDFTPPLPSDLIITKLWMSDEKPSEGDIVTLYAEVKNQGEGNTVQDVSLSFMIDDEEVGFSTSTAIDSGNSSDSFSLDIRWKVPLGNQFTLKAWVDDVNKISEDNEENNQLEVKIENEAAKKAPDVVINSLTWSPSKIYVGDNVVFHSSVTNQGNSDTVENVGVGYFVDNKQVGYGARAAMPANSNSTDFDLTKAYVASSAGEFELLAFVDDLNRFRETDELNNKSSINFTVHSKEADLIIEELWWEPNEAQIGDTLKLFAKVKNDSPFDTTKNVGVAFYLGDTKIGWGATTALVAGASVEIAIREGEIKLDSFGTYEISALVNDEKAIKESVYSNNTKAKSLTLLAPLPDVSIEDIWWTPLVPEVGDEVTFHARVKNISAYDTGANVGLAYYINGEKIGWGATTALSAGESSDVFTNREGTWTATEGSFEFSALVNDSHTFEEFDESNNVFVKTLLVKPKAIPIEKIEQSIVFPTLDENFYFKTFDPEVTVLYEKTDALTSSEFDNNVLLKIEVPAGVKSVILENEFSSKVQFSITQSAQTITPQLCNAQLSEDCFEESALQAISSKQEITRGQTPLDEAFTIYLHLQSSDETALNLGAFSTLMIVDDVTKYTVWQEGSL